jgi:hypothetical protein
VIFIPDQKPPTQNIPPTVLDGMDLTVFQDLEVRQEIQPVINIDERGKTYSPVRSSLTSYAGPAAPVGKYDASARLKINSSDDPDEYTTIEAAGTADGLGDIAATAFLAAAGTGLKWMVEDLTVQLNLPTIVGTQIVVSDGIGRVQASGYAVLSAKQGTANTAITFTGTALAANCQMVIRGRARKVV